MRRHAGFTLIEVLVSLAVALLITGGVMGLFSSGFQLMSRVKTKTADMRILDAAAQMVLASPGIVWKEETIAVQGFQDEPEVEVTLEKIERLETGRIEFEDRGLYRVSLTYGKTTIWFSLIIVEDDYRKKQEGRDA